MPCIIKFIGGSKNGDSEEYPSENPPLELRYMNFDDGINITCSEPTAASYTTEIYKCVLTETLRFGGDRRAIYKLFSTLPEIPLNKPSHRLNLF